MSGEPIPMKPALTEQVLFSEALLRHSPEGRAAYLAEACGRDMALRRRVEELLNASENAGDFLEQPPTALGGDAQSNELSEKPGDRIGRYKLLEKIGEGGCGVVYMADQEEPVRRRVALKIIKPGMDTRAVIARFEAERQALALMDHPNIAKVLDGGATSSGRPYFVMELVRGVRITEFCDAAQLGTGARLRLFVHVCNAIQHAHQKGIVHRDLKPSNILVTINDGAAVPKVIDFGIAKATGQRLTDKTVFTQFHAFIGTPAYTSPEQAEMSSVDIDTRSDIYSLGVLLYELLTGKTPFDGDELLRSGLDEMRRTIRETEPPRPSTRLTSLVAAGARKRPGTKSESGSAKSELNPTPSRGLQPTKELISDVRGDLDWIVMKCLEKDRARRYATANGLAADIQRHLDHEPVSARSPNRMYLFKKLARRNRGSLLALAIIVVALLLAVVTLATSNARIRRERNLKDQALQARGTALEVARASEQRARDQLFVSLQNQAQARRNSRKIGQRAESLAALTEAARIHPATELRDNAIAAMALPDVELGPVLRDWNPEAKILAFDPLYERYARLELDSISIRTIPEGRELRRIAASGTPGTQFIFSPDGRFLAWLDSSGKPRVWRWETGGAILKDFSARCSVFAFSEDSRRVAVGQDGWIICFDVSTGDEIRRWQSRDRICSMGFSLDSRWLAAGYEEAKLVSIYNADNGQLEADLPMGESSITFIAWHPGGNLIATGGSDSRIQIWDVKARRKLAVLEGHAQQITFLSFHPGGDTLLSGSWDGVMRLWQPLPGQMLMRLPLPGCMGFSRDGRWAGTVSASNQQPQLWGIVPSREYRTFSNPFGEGEVDFYEGDISPDGRLLALGGSDGVRLWDVESGREAAWLAMGETTAAVFRANGSELLTCGPADGLQRWPVRAVAEAPGGLQLGPAQPIALPFPPTRISKAENDRMLAVVGESKGRCLLLDLVTESAPVPEIVHLNAGFIALSQNAEWVASSGWHSDRVKVWNGLSGRLVKDLEAGLTARVFFTPDNRELIISRVNEFTFHDLKTLEVSRRLPRQIGLFPGYVAFTADGKLMALEMAPGLIHLKEVNSGRTVAKLEDPQGDVSTWMSFTPDGTQLVVAARYATAIHHWDLRAIRAGLKPMNLDWDWPEFPATAPVETSFFKNHSPLRVEVVGARKPLAAQSSATNAPSGQP